MLLIPSLDLVAGRSRLVWWPGASTGKGTPTDRPEVIARTLVERGAPALHLVDLDGARLGRPVNLSAVTAVARAVARPLQLAGGIDGPEQVELAFAAGATRVVVPLWAVAEDPVARDACLRVAGAWLAVGLEGRDERLGEYPWRHRAPPSLEVLLLELASAGVQRFVLSHAAGRPDLGTLVGLAGGLGAEVLVAGGVGSVEDIAAIRDAGAAGVILGEALFSGAVDLEAALRTVEG
jgi:phosphoribosylformimino-5-aminoimidazole carboxamide ribotide isomerase